MNQEHFLIALDMDGTLLNKDHQICEKTATYLKSLAKQGHKIIISSGRPIRGIMPYYEQLELDTPVICYNGAYIYGGKEIDFPEYCFSFPRDIIIKIIKEIGYECIDNIVLETNNDIYMLRDDDDLDIFFSKKNMCVHIGKIERILDQDPMTMLIKVKDPKVNEQVKQIVEQNENIRLRFWSGRWFEISEIYYDHIHKGNALDKIKSYYSIDSDHVIAFGDADNDIELLKNARYGFAMKNAEEELKKAIGKVTEFDNNHDGIMIELQKIIKKIES